MKHILLDNRRENDIIENIKQLASYYIPEWDFNENQPDMGVALALIYANMLENTIDNLNELPHKYLYSYANLLKVKPLPASSAEGFVTIEVVEGAPDGVYIKKGTKLYATVDEESKVIFETENDLYAVDNDVKSIYYANPFNNSINCLYDYQKEEIFNPVNLFDNMAGESISEKYLYIGDDHNFKISSNGEIKLEFANFDHLYMNKKTIDLLGNEKNDWTLLFGNSEHKLLHKIDGDKLSLKIDGIDDVSEETTLGDIRSIWIKCDYTNAYSKEEINANSIVSTVENYSLTPDKTFTNDIENMTKTIKPFGDRIALYDEFYILSNEAFSKKNGLISLNFDLEYEKAKIDLGFEKQPVNWKMIMKERDFNDVEEFDITIENIVWEYWNGNGWARLSVNEKYDKLFNGYITGRKQIVFKCPKDIKSNLVNAHEGYYIKGRINKVNNAYKTNGYYIVPKLSNLVIDYKLEKSTNKHIVIEKNRERKTYYSNSVINIIGNMEEKSPVIYFEIEEKLEGGPIKIFFSIEENISDKVPNIKWEYYCNKDGINGWHELNLFDGTDDFSHSGVITFIPTEELQKKKVFGKKGYWIRAVNIDNGYANNIQINYPKLKKVLFNTVEITQKNQVTVEYFSNYEEELNKELVLQYVNVVDIDLWVDEVGYINKKELEKLLELNDKAEIVYNDDGTIIEIWVKWEKVDDLALSTKNDRHFSLNEVSGTIIFGDGKNGRIPPKQETESIRVNYSVGGGIYGNVLPYKIDTIGDSVAFVNKIFNYEPTYGGANKESVDEAANRASSIIKRGSRIITTRDFENFVVEEFRNISACKVITHYNDLGEEEIGSVTIVVLPSDYFNGYSYFASIKKKLLNIFREKAPEVLTKLDKIYIREAKYVEVSVDTKIIINNYDDYKQVFTDINEGLNIYLDPINGNYNNKGWDIGQVPNNIQLYNYIKTIDNVKQIKKMLVSYKTITKEGNKEIDLDRIKDKNFVIPIPGINKINIAIE